MKNSFIIFLLISNLFLFSQEDDSYNLDYNNSKNAAELCTEYKSSSFLSNAEADNALSKILSVVGASKRFIVAPCEDINNALAIIDDGMRYILYDPEFINSISQTSNYWANMSILAHEVGHHINGHTLGASVSAYENKIQELESDEFSGFVMQKIGSTLEQATDAIASIASSGDDTYSSHPNKERRIKAITKGFNNAKNNSFITEKKITDWEEYYFRGNEKYEAENFQGAIEDYTESIRLKPDMNTYLKRALAKEDIDDISGAKFDLLRSIEIEPNLWKSHYHLGRILYRLNDYYGTLSAFSSYFDLVEITGDYYDIWSGHFMAKSFFYEGFYNKSLEYMNIILDDLDYKSKIDEEDHFLFFLFRGKIYLKLENYELSKKDFETASELNPKDAVIKELMGDAYAGEKNYNKALELYNQALELDSEKYSIYQYRAYIYEALEDYFMALLDMNEAIKHAPDYGYLYFKRGEYHFKMGNKENACSDWLIGREKGDSESYNKLLETCLYSEEDFYDADDFLYYAIKAKDDSKFDEALRLLAKSRELGYKDIYYLETVLYSIYANSEQQELALEVLNKIEEDTKDINIVWWNRSFIYINYSLKNWSQVTSKSKELISRFKLDPNSTDYSIDLDFINENLDFVHNLYDYGGQAHYLSGNYIDGIDNNNKFLKVGKTIESDYFISYAYLRNAENKKGSGDYLGAIQDINDYIKLTDDFSLGYSFRGEIKLNMGEAYKKYACEDFNLALQISLKNENEDEEDQQEIQKFIDDNCN